MRGAESSWLPRLVEPSFGKPDLGYRIRKFFALLSYRSSHAIHDEEGTFPGSMPMLHYVADPGLWPHQILEDLSSLKMEYALDP